MRKLLTAGDLPAGLDPRLRALAAGLTLDDVPRQSFVDVDHRRVPSGEIALPGGGWIRFVPMGSGLEVELALSSCFTGQVVRISLRPRWYGAWRAASVEQTSGSTGGAGVEASILARVCYALVVLAGGVVLGAGLALTVGSLWALHDRGGWADLAGAVSVILSAGGWRGWLGVLGVGFAAGALVASGLDGLLRVLQARAARLLRARLEGTTPDRSRWAPVLACLGVIVVILGTVVAVRGRFPG